MVRRRGQTVKIQKAPQSPPKPDIEEETYFLNPEAVSQHLYCCICQEVFKEPWRAPCGHSYCKRCIFDWLSKNSICPTDRKPVTVAQLHHDFLVQNIIDDYVVACPWRALGCHNVGPLHQLKEHKKVCPLNPNNMPKVLQDYSVQVLSTAQQELQRKQVQRSLAAASTSRQSLPSVAGPARQSSSSSTSMFDQLLSEVLERGDSSSNDGVQLPSTNNGASIAFESVDRGSYSFTGVAADGGEGVTHVASSANGEVAAPSTNGGAATASANGGAANSSANGGPATSSANWGAAASSANEAAATSAASGGAAASATNAADSSFDDDEANLPGGQLPSLRMRLYMNSQPQGRSEFVSFLENLNTQPQLLHLPKSISRFCEPPDSKRPRLDDD